MGLNWSEGFKGAAKGLQLIGERQVRREELEYETLRRENFERLQSQLASERQEAHDTRVGDRQEKHDVAMADRSEKTALRVTERQQALLAERERASDERFSATHERLETNRDIAIGEENYGRMLNERDRAMADMEKARSELQRIRKEKAEGLGLDPNSDDSLIQMAESDDLVRSHLYAMRDADKRRREAEAMMNRLRPMQGDSPPRRGGTRNRAAPSSGPSSRNRRSLIPQDRPKLINDMGD